MPNYTFANKKNGRERNETMTIAAMETFLKENPDWYVVIKPLGVRDNFVASRHTNIPIDTDFKSMLDNMKAANPGSSIDY